MFKIKFILSKLKSKKKEEKESFSLKDSDNREFMLSRPKLLKKIEEGLKKKELGETEKKQLVVRQNLKDKERNRVSETLLDCSHLVLFTLSAHVTTV